MTFVFTLNGGTLLWDATCTLCGYWVSVCPLGEEPVDPPDHTCGEVTNTSMLNLLDVDGIESVSRVMGFPEDLLP